MKTDSRRGVITMAITALLVVACGGGSGGGTATTAASGDTATTAAAEEPTATTAAAEEPAATTAAAEPATTAAAEAVTLSFLIDDNPVTIDTAERSGRGVQEANPNISIEIETRPGGSEGDNIVKTRLATGEMTDIFWYNTGSLFQALNPTESLVPITDEPYVEDIVEDFLTTVTAGEDIYGVPAGTGLGGGVLYNKAIYEDLGLSVPTRGRSSLPTTMRSSQSGIAPVGQTYSDTWTSQLFVLADLLQRPV